MKIVYLTLRVEIPEDINAQDFAAECCVTVIYNGEEVEQTIDDVKGD